MYWNLENWRWKLKYYIHIKINVKYYINIKIHDLSRVSFSILVFNFSLFLVSFNGAEIVFIYKMFSV